MTTASGSRTSCIRHRENKRFFILFEDLLQICNFEYIQACALRVLEVKTNDRLTEIYDKPRRDRHADMDRMFLTISYNEFKHYSLQLYAESSYQIALAQLEQRGFVESRAVQLDAQGRVIKVYPVLRVVADDRGRALKEYDFGGDKSYVKQYRLKYETVNAAIDTIEPMPNPDNPPPDDGEEDEEGNEASTNANQGGNLENGGGIPPLQNTTHDPHVKSQGGYQNKQGEKNMSHTGCETTPPPSENTRGHGKNTSTRGKNASGASETRHQKKEKNLEVIPKNTKKDSAPAGEALSLLKDVVDFDWLKTAPWEPNTLIMLASALVPVPAVCDDETWEREWYKPAERLLAATSTLEPDRAWERINQELAYMTEPNSPSWWVQQRARQSPITLRHAADNYVVMDRERTTRQWYSSTIVPYMGESPSAWSQLLTSQHRQLEEPSSVMDRATADALAEEILSCYPDLILASRRVEGGYILGFKYAEGQWRTISSTQRWRMSSPLLLRRLEQASAYAVESNREAVVV